MPVNKKQKYDSNLFVKELLGAVILMIMVATVLALSQKEGLKRSYWFENQSESTSNSTQQTG
ncbi:MAG: hypothetical protein AAGA30_08210 [Planctomycetota bacterium]